MNKSNINEQSAQTEADNNSTAQNHSVSQPNANMNVGRSAVEYILCAAIWYKNGKKYVHQPKNVESGYVMCGRRHHNIITLHHDLTGLQTKCEGIEQGFITNTDRFVGRCEAGQIAFKAGQITWCKEKPVTEPLISEELYSEDLY